MSTKKNYLTEEAVEIMKQMNPQELANILLLSDDWPGLKSPHGPDED